MSERFLEKCLERKGHFRKGWVKSFRSSDPDASTQPGKGWGVFGKKEVFSYIIYKFVKGIWLNGEYLSEYPDIELEKWSFLWSVMEDLQLYESCG